MQLLESTVWHWHTCLLSCCDHDLNGATAVLNVWALFGNLMAKKRLTFSRERLCQLALNSQRTANTNPGIHPSCTSFNTALQCLLVSLKTHNLILILRSETQIPTSWQVCLLCNPLSYSCLFSCRTLNNIPCTAFRHLSHRKPFLFCDYYWSVRKCFMPEAKINKVLWFTFFSF